NPKVMGNRVKMKIDGLFTLYKTHEKCLQLTGEGIGNSDQEDSSQGPVTLQFYIQVNGPDENTPLAAVNIWDEIVSSFPFFPCLHH
ncbi:hypothetical protein BDQ17DRAFT_1223833, partial [Cyathus striatus]